MLSHEQVAHEALKYVSGFPRDTQLTAAVAFLAGYHTANSPTNGPSVPAEGLRALIRSDLPTRRN